MTHNPAVTPEFNALERFGRPVRRAGLACLTRADLPWHETAAETRAALARARERARLLDWVRAQMLLRLSPVERRCIELYFFEDLHYREAAERLGASVTSVHRGVRRGLRKLRQAARDHPPRVRRRRRARRRPEKWALSSSAVRASHRVAGLSRSRRAQRTANP